MLARNGLRVLLRPQLARTAWTAPKAAPRVAVKPAAVAYKKPAAAPATPLADHADEIGFDEMDAMSAGQENSAELAPPLPPMATTDDLSTVGASSEGWAGALPQGAMEASSYASAKQAAEIDWSTSFHGLSAQPFSERAAKILMRPLQPMEIEIKPDGLLYLPEILYRRILNQAFGPGGWGMVPRGDMTVANRVVSREWGLVAGGRLVAIARGEQTFFDPSGVATATEGCKSNALMRCCKDLGIASELWDPTFIRNFKLVHCVEGWVEHVTTKKKQKRWRKKHNKWEYPYKGDT